MKSTKLFRLEKATPGTVSFTVSSENPDRVGDTFTPAALQKLARTHKKLIALFAHDHAKPVGYWSNFRVQGKRLIADLHLAETNLGLMLKKLVESDVPLMSSVGFSAVDYSENKKGGYEFNDVDLHEISVVSVGMNPEAKLIAKQFGFSETQCDAFCKAATQSADSETKADYLAKINKTLLEINTCLSHNK